MSSPPIVIQVPKGRSSVVLADVSLAPGMVLGTEKIAIKSD